MNTPPPITPLEFDESDFQKAEKLASALGYEQTAYISTSALKRRHTSIPLLAFHINLYNQPPTSKADFARMRATIADRVYAASEPVQERI